jgi:hypothetical protein
MTVQTVRLTADNIEAELLPGDVFTDDPEAGIVKSHRPMRDGSGDAMVYFAGGGHDVFGLPQTVRIIRAWVTTPHPPVWPNYIDNPS